MKPDKLEMVRNYLIGNIIQNPDIMFSDEIRSKYDIDLIEVIVSLYELLHFEVTGDSYNYMFHFANKIGAWVDDQLFYDMEVKK